MNQTEFCHWLKGFIDGNETEGLTKEQLDRVYEELNSTLTDVKATQSRDLRDFTPVELPPTFPGTVPYIHYNPYGTPVIGTSTSPFPPGVNLPSGLPYGTSSVSVTTGYCTTENPSPMTFTSGGISIEDLIIKQVEEHPEKDDEKWLSIVTSLPQ